MSPTWLLLIAANLLLATSSPTQRQQRDAANSYACDHPECYQFATEMAAAIDWTVDPCDDFYQFSCGRWLRKAENPEHKRILDELTLISDKVNDRIEDILLYNKNGEEEEALQKASRAYKSCVNAHQYVEVNLQDIRRTVDYLGGWNVGASGDVTAHSLVKNIIDLAKTTDLQVPFQLKVLQMENNSSYFYVNLNYPENKNFLTSKFPVHDNDIALIAAEVFGQTISLADARKVLQFEEDAKNMSNDDDDDDDDDEDDENYDYESGTITLKNFKPSDSFDFIEILNKIFENIKTFTGDETIGVDSISYYKKFFKYIEQPGNAKIVKDYMMLYVILTYLHEMGASLPDPLRKINSLNDFWTDKSRMDICLPFVNKCFDYVIAKKYGELYLDIPNDKRKLKEMTGDLMKVFHERLETLPWLDEKSRMNALNKLENLHGLFEYPDWASDLQSINKYYDDVEAYEGRMVESSVSCEQHLRKLSLRKLVVPPGDLKWPASPLIANAFYNKYANEIYILEGISGSPDYNGHRLRLFNYATMGGFVGHELTHGFDNKGINYDAYGNKIKWLSEESQAQFDKGGKCLIDQYSGYSFTPKDLPEDPRQHTLNGKISLAENIADLGSIILSYKAYQNWVENHQPEILPEILAQNFTNEQVFFLAYSYIRCEKLIRNYDSVFTRSHSPMKFRVIGPLSNFEEFGKAFDCPSNANMVRGEQACHIW